MQWTKQQKVYGAVLGLAVVAFGVDRWVIGHDDEAADAAHVADVAPRQSRRPAPVQRSAEGRATAALVPAPAPLAPSTLASRLEEAARVQRLNLEQINDAFRPSTAWVGTPRTATVAELRDEARDFLQRHRLTAVMKQTAGGVAIIDQKTVAVGQSLDGFRLVAVKDRSAVLRRGGQRVELRLPEENLAAPGSEKLANTGSGN